MKQRILAVQGNAKIKMTPDTIVLNIKLIGKSKDYAESSDILNKKISILQNDIVKLGFERKDIKTISYDIKDDHKYAGDKKIILGFESVSRCKIEFDWNNELLKKLITNLSNSKSEPNLDIEFSIKDKEPFRKLLLENAVKNAKANADVLANAANVKLGNIIEIMYGKLEIEFKQNILYAPSLGINDNDFDFNPEDLESEDKVSVVWEIV